LSPWIAAEPTAVRSYIKKQTVTITIGVSFFVFGFFIVANLLKLTERDVVVGLISGAVGGVTMLAVSLAQERRARDAVARPA
jgi:ABC-type iron transport system FetAB permease component